MSNSMQSPQYTSSPPTNTMAVVSLVASIVSWVFFPIIAAIVGIVTGHIARREIRDSYGAQSGDGLAIAGLIISYLNLATYCFALMFVVLIFGGAFGLGACAILSESTGLIFSNDSLGLLFSN